MRCKAGDTVIVTKSWAGNEGKIFTVLRLSPHRGLLGPNGLVEGVVWEIDVAIPSFIPGIVARHALDHFLRPIRPGALDEEATESRELEAA